jgi:hypothetical protein
MVCNFPGQAGVQDVRKALKKLDSRSPIHTFGDKFHGNDGKAKAKTSYEIIRIDDLVKNTQCEGKVRSFRRKGQRYPIAAASPYFPYASPIIGIVASGSSLGEGSFPHTHLDGQRQIPLIFFLDKIPAFLWAEIADNLIYLLRLLQKSLVFGGFFQGLGPFGNDLFL